MDQKGSSEFFFFSRFIIVNRFPVTVKIALAEGAIPAAGLWTNERERILPALGSLVEKQRPLILVRQAAVTDKRDQKRRNGRTCWI